MAGAQNKRKKDPPQQSPEARAWAQQISDEDLLCRDLGHVWHPDTARFDQRQRAFHQTLRCDRCGTLRRRVLDRNGGIMGSSYTYQPTYLAPKGLGPYDAAVRSVLRLASITRVLSEAAQAAQKTAVVTDITNARKPK
jgi:hypothetical protein